MQLIRKKQIPDGEFPYSLASNMDGVYYNAQLDFGIVIVFRESHNLDFSYFFAVVKNNGGNEKNTKVLAPYDLFPYLLSIAKFRYDSDWETIRHGIKQCLEKKDIFVID